MYVGEALSGEGNEIAHIDLLIDGPFISSMSEGAGEYRGSRNQRLIGRML